MSSTSISTTRAVDMGSTDTCPSTKKRRLTLNKSTGSQGINFLSLPEDIVSRITAEITLKDALRMSAVCSRLTRAWIYHPNLDFDNSAVPADGIARLHVPGNKVKSKQSLARYKRMLRIQRFIGTVNFMLSQHSGFAVSRLSVKFGLHKKHANDIDGWVSFAIASKARAVALDFSPYQGACGNYYTFPCHLFHNHNSSHLQVLRLNSVTLDPSHDFCGFSNLTTLALDNVLILQDLQYLLVRCPALESLSIRLSAQLRNLHVAEPLQQLKFLCVQGCGIDKIDLHAPNLTAFNYRGRSEVLITLKECLKLEKASIAFHAVDNLEYIFTGLPIELPHVETLHVEASVKTQIHGFAQAPLKFMCLRHLSMRITLSSAKRYSKNAILQIAYLLDAAPLLVDLHLDMLLIAPCEFPPNRDVISDHPHHSLKQACITGFNGNGGQVALVKYILRNAVQLERMAIDPNGDYEGLLSAKSELVPKDRKGVLTILGDL